jgi:hypothetical protein
MRGSQPVGGQYWRKGDLQLACANQVCFNADSSKKSVVLSSVHDAVAWRHALEMTSDPKLLRSQQRIIVFLEILKDLNNILNSGDLRLDPEGNRAELYQKISDELATFANRPVLLCESDPATKIWPGLAEHVEEWMCKAEQIAVGCQREVHGRNGFGRETENEACQVDASRNGPSKSGC